MREILFRGKRHNGEWYYGSYLFLNVPSYDWKGDARGKAESVHYIINEKDINYAVDPSTVGQFTGLTDKKSKKIFEGDIIEWDELEWGSKHREVVTWDYGLFAMREDDWGEWCKVIGNIHDNPDLLEGGADHE